MRSIVISFAVVALLAVHVSASDQVQWSTDFQAACAQADQRHQLVLLHFYSDDCPPCVRVEQQVFSKPEVAETLARCCVPMKVHVKQNPELARKYNIQRWPTDILVTPAGQEVHRTISPQSPAQYQTFVEQVSLQAGCRPLEASPYAAAQQSPATGPGPVAGNPYETQLPPSDRNNFVSGMAGPTHNYADSRLTPQPPVQPQQQQSPPSAASGYASPPAGGYLAPPPANLGNYQPANDPAASPYGPSTAPPQAQNAAQWGPQNGPYDSAASQAPTAPVAPGPAYSAAPPTQQIVNRYAQPGVAPTAPPAYNNPSGVAPPLAAGPYGAQPPADIAPAAGQLVTQSQAPSVALDGCCAVTMIESRKMRKADPQFGAVHRGRTYLFMSAAEQQKFLADPDRYALVLSGYDAVRFARTGEMVEGQKQFGIMYQGHIYLFADELSLNQFTTAPQSFSVTAYQAMLNSEASGATIRR